MKKTNIFAGFPGVGKSELIKMYGADRVSDSDSSEFSWIYNEDGTKEGRNPDFPNNYIEHIRSLIGEKEVILVSTHKDVLNALSQAGIPFTIVYPSRSLKSVYMGRYEQRGSDAGFLAALDTNWDSFIDDIESFTDVPKICLHGPDQYLSDLEGSWFGQVEATTIEPDPMEDYPEGE